MKAQTLGSFIRLRLNSISSNDYDTARLTDSAYNDIISGNQFFGAPSFSNSELYYIQGYITPDIQNNLMMAIFFLC